MDTIKKKKKKFHLSKKALTILVSIVVVIAAIVGGILIWLYCGDKVCSYCGRNTFTDKVYRNNTVVCCEFCYDEMFKESGVDPDKYFAKEVPQHDSVTEEVVAEEVADDVAAEEVAA